MSVVDDLAWQSEGLCQGVDPDLFFPERGDSTINAKTVCASCPVRLVCLRYSIDNHEKFGIWGGMSERERRRIRNGKLPFDVPVNLSHGTPKGPQASRSLTVEEIDAAVQLYDHGETLTQIAYRLGVSRNCVTRHVKRAKWGALQEAG